MKQMKWGRRLVAVGLLLSFCICLFGCETKGKQEADVRALLHSAISFRLSAERRGEVFVADVRLGEGDSMERDMELRFLSPSSVEGLTVRQKSGELQTEFGSLSVKEDAVWQILLLLAPFSIGHLRQSTSYREGDLRVFCYVAEGESVTYYVNSESLPEKIIYTVPGETVTLYPTNITLEGEPT